MGINGTDVPLQYVAVGFLFVAVGFLFVVVFIWLYSLWRSNARLEHRDAQLTKYAIDTGIKYAMEAAVSLAVVQERQEYVREIAQLKAELALLRPATAAPDQSEPDAAPLS